MRVLVIHLGFPGQYEFLTPHLVALGHQVVGLHEKIRQATRVRGCQLYNYPAPEAPVGLTEPETWSACAYRRAENVANAVLELVKRGFTPDLILGHVSWGETLFLKDVVPSARVVVYCEFMNHPLGTGLDFDQEFTPAQPPLWPRIHNGVLLSCLERSDRGIAPTHWQRSTFPSAYEKHIAVIHDGIDTDLVKPDPKAVFRWEGQTYTPGDEVVTYISRSLEPHRGFHIFMRALPEIQRRRPKARIVIAGKDMVSYSAPLKSGETYFQHMTRELGPTLEMTRIQFTGQLPYGDYVRLLQVSSAHVYLTYPSTLSWSATEAMAAACLVVGSRTKPVEELIEDGVNGLLVDFFSPEELATRVADALERQAELEPLREAARRTVLERYDLKRVCLPAQMKLIEEVMR